MILLVFLNKYDKQVHIMGKELPSYLKGDFVKVFTRYPDKEYDQCEVEDTFAKIKEYAKVFDKVIVSFGLRLFPPSAYKDIVKEYKKTDRSVVFLKEMRGSKTWSVTQGQLSYDNFRIVDTGIFILSAQDIKDSKTNNFNTFLKELVRKGSLDHKYVSYWLLTSSKRTPPKRRR